jgi:CRP/FNR family transcriptional regulator, cyclic AMP receptor protein
VVGLPRVESVPCFAALAPPVRAALAEALNEVDVPAGKRVASQGDFAYELFAIVEGTARVEQDGALVATLGPGEVFGEIGLLMTGRRRLRSSPRRRWSCSRCSTRASCV